MAQDKLARQEFVKKAVEVIERVSNFHNGCCFAIEGKWGVGKTFVLDMIEEELNKIKDSKKNCPKYNIIKYNCWEYDYYEEPIIAIISAIIDSINSSKTAIENVVDNRRNILKAFAKAIKCFAKSYSANKLGINKETLNELEEIINQMPAREISNKEFDTMYSFKDALKYVQKELVEIAKKQKIIIIIDELDRCIPQYAIKVLERLHHLFYGIENIEVILSVDSNQLNNSIQQIYGQDVDVEKYLKKFIDFSVVLDEGSLSDEFFSDNEFFEKFDDFEYRKEEFYEFVKCIFDGIDMRGRKKIFQKTELVHNLIIDEKCNTFVLAYELLVGAMRYKNMNPDIDWILYDGKENIEKNKNKLGKVTTKYLNEMHENIAYNYLVPFENSRKNLIKYFDDIKTYIFACIRKIYHDNNQVNEFIYERNFNGIKENVEIIKKFMELEKVIK